MAPCWWPTQLRHLERVVVLAWVVRVAGGRARARGTPAEVGVDVVFVNPYERARELYWIPPSTVPPSPPNKMGTLAALHGEAKMTTYVGHEFGWRPVPEDRGVPPCASADELEGRVTVAGGMRSYALGEAQPETAKDPKASDEPFLATFANSSPRRTMELRRADGALAAPAPLAPRQEAQVEVKRAEYVDWFDAETRELLYRSVIEYHGQARHTFDDRGHTTLCEAARAPSPPVRETTYRAPSASPVGQDASVEEDSPPHAVAVLSETPFVAVVRNWTTTEECRLLEAAARRTGLAGAQVFGTRAIIADRRALSANLYWDARNATALTNRLIERAFALTTHFRGYPLVPGPAQEPLNFIQYGFAEEYRPHCDGVCQRRPYARGGRVATLLHYCKVPDTGGATVFPRLDVKVQANANDALLFTYKGDDGMMDDGFTLHAGCLVGNGTKQVLTMWMREDVHDGEPWSDFLS